MKYQIRVIITQEVEACDKEQAAEFVINKLFRNSEFQSVQYLDGKKVYDEHA